jgi:hypothetical protein
MPGSFTADVTSTVVAAAATTPADVSGARQWAAACAVNGSMRCWVELDGHASVGHHSFNSKETQAVDEVDVVLWTASLVLLHHLEAHAAVDWRGLRVLDLSSGSGHLAVGLSRLGAHVTASACSPKHDRNAWRALNIWLPFLIRERPGGQCPSADASPPYGSGELGGTVALRQINWGEEEESLAAADHDVLVLSELTALGEELQTQLLKTVCRLLGPTTVAYSIFGDHGAFCQGFNWLLTWDPSFEIEEIEVVDRLGTHEDETLYMYKITRPTPGLTAAQILELAAD